jgi:PAS domain S-box-containing protein
MQPLPGITSRRLLGAALTAVVFLLDLVTPPGLNVPILYLIPLLLAFFSERVRVQILLTVSVSALAVVGVAWGWKWNDVWLHGLINRTFDLGVFWVALLLSIRNARTTRELRDLWTALDNASIVSLTDAAGVIEHVNDRFCAVSQYSRDALIGRTHPVVNPGTCAAGTGDELWATIADGRVWHGEVRDIARDGSAYWVDSTIVPFVDERGAPYRYLAIQHDISQQKRSEARLRSQASLARICEMAAIVAHAVRNPIAGVRAGLQLFARGSSLSADDARLVGQMTARLDLLTTQVSALMHFARPRSPIMREVELHAVLRDAVAVVRATEAGAGITVAVMPGEVRVLGDRAMLIEIFTQLLLNAAEAQQGVGNVDVSFATAGDAVEVRVADHGPGVPAPLRERIFEPLFTTRGTGTGLGLPIAKQLAELQGGGLVIGDSSASGTSIRVDLQRAPEHAAAVIGARRAVLATSR